MYNFIQGEELCKNIVFIDGMWGTGNQCLALLLGASKGVEKCKKIDYNFEYLCILNYFKKINGSRQKIF